MAIQGHSRSGNFVVSERPTIKGLNNTLYVGLIS